MKGAILTQTQSKSILGQIYADYSYFNPVLDFDSNIYITENEILNCVNPNFAWVKNLTIITINPIVYAPPTL